jgi:hypothetical protein
VRTQKVTVLAAVTMVVLLAAGCGSKKSSSSAPTTTAAAASETTTEAMTTEAMTTTSSSSSSGGAPSFASTKNCKELEGLAAKVSQSFQPNSSGELDLKKEADALDALADAAPDDIKGDFKTFADAFRNFAKAYGDTKIKPGQTPTAEQIAKLTKAAQSLNTPKFQQATQHLSQWGSAHCGASSTG